MSEQTLEQIRVDKSLKEEVTRTEALRAFEELRRQAADVPEMSLEEINQEITEVRNMRGKKV